MERRRRGPASCARAPAKMDTLTRCGFGRHCAPSQFRHLDTSSFCPELNADLGKRSHSGKEYRRPTL